MIQILKPDGTLANGAVVPNLSEKNLKKLYQYMILTRELDDKMLKLQRQGRIGFSVPQRGQEAIVGSALALDAKDWVFPAYREYAVGLFRGLPLKETIAQYFGNEFDPIKGRQMPNHFSHKQTNFVSISSPIGTQIGQAAGAAIAAKIKGDSVVAITYFGDGGTSSTDFHAGLNIAGTMKAPCIFFCSNNQLAISVPVEKQTAVSDLSLKAMAYGFKGVRVDGNDVLAVYQVVKEAADRAREGIGPTFIESVTFRMGAHSSSDDPSLYCPKSKYDEWAKKDPIERFKAYLISQKMWSEDEDTKLITETREQLQDMVSGVMKGKQPELSTLFEDVYKEMPYHLKMQHNELLEEAKRKGEFVDTSEAFPL
jgi:pyruvate dehydrogenase E1 component alpha subunit